MWGDYHNLMVDFKILIFRNIQIFNTFYKHENYHS